jgi:hypothetical protein
MPIDYDHGNPLIGLVAASQIGAAQFQREQERLAREQEQVAMQQGQFDAQLAERQRQFDLDQQLRLNMADLEGQRSNQSRGFELARDRTQAATQQLADWQNFQQQLTLNQSNNQAMLERLGYQSQLSMDANEQEWMIDSGKQADVSAKEALSGYRQMQLRPEGERIRAEWDAKIRAFQGKRGELRPEVYANGMGQILEGMSQAGIEDFEIKDMPLEDIRAQRTVDIDENNVLIIQPDGKISLQGRVMPKPTPPEKPEDPAKIRIPTPLGEMTQNDFDTQFGRLYNEAEQRVIARMKAADPSAREGATYTADQAEVLVEIERFRKAREAFFNGQGLQPPTAESGPAAEPAAPPPPPPPIADMPVFNPAAANSTQYVGYFRWMGKTHYRDETGQLGVEE